MLVVDEVLAVGDAGFQKKCISAMEDLRSGGRTVLFVSHNMAAVENLCSRGLWIERGELRMDGAAKEVIRAYLGSYASEQSNAQELQTEGRTGTGEVRFTRVELLGANGTASRIIQSGDSLAIRMHFRAERRVDYPNFCVRLYTGMGTLITETSTALSRTHSSRDRRRRGFDRSRSSARSILFRIATRVMFRGGSSGTDGRVYDGDVRAFLDVEPSGAYGTARALDSRFGIVYFPQRWKAPISY